MLMWADDQALSLWLCIFGMTNLRVTSLSYVHKINFSLTNLSFSNLPYQKYVSFEMGWVFSNNLIMSWFFLQLIPASAIEVSRQLIEHNYSVSKVITPSHHNNVAAHWKIGWQHFSLKKWLLDDLSPYFTLYQYFVFVILSMLIHM